MLFNDRRANARALKAANGPSLAPKGYKPDTEARTIAQDNGNYFAQPWKSRKNAMASSAEEVDSRRGVKTVHYVPSKLFPGKVDPQQVTTPKAPQNKKGR